MAYLNQIVDSKERDVEIFKEVVKTFLGNSEALDFKCVVENISKIQRQGLVSGLEDTLSKFLF